MNKFIFICLLLFSFRGFSQPVNDNCSGALDLTSTMTCRTGDVLGATQSGTTGCAGTNTNDLWYKFTASSSSASIAVTPSSGFDAVVEVLSGCSGPSITCKDASYTGGIETVNLSGLTTGNTYYIRVYHYYSSYPSTTTFTICLTLENDNCSSATSIAVGECVEGTVLNATQSQTGCVGTADDDVWYKFTASTSIMSVEVVPSSSLDPVLQVFTSCGGSSLTCVESYNTGGTETATFNNLTPGVTYYARVYHYSSSKATTPTFQICVNSLANPPDNDDCADAVSLVSDTAVSGNLNHATQSQTGCTGTANDDVWYTFTASSSVHYLNLLGNSFDAVLQVFDECNGNSIACVDEGGEEHVKLTGLTVGEDYYARVYSYSSSFPSNSDFDILLSDELTVTLDAVPAALCSGKQADISFSTAGNINSANEFKIYLSNDTGSFLSETFIGSGTSSPVSVTIPTTVKAGTGYKIRIKSTVPTDTYDSSAAFTISTVPMDLNYDGNNIIVTASGSNSPYQYKLNSNAWQSSSTLSVPSLNIRHTAYVQDNQGCISSATFKVTSGGTCEMPYEKDAFSAYEFRPFALGTASGGVSVIYDAGGIADQIEVSKNNVTIASSGGETPEDGFLTFPYDASTGSSVIVKVSSSASNTSALYSVSCPLPASAVTMTTGTASVCQETLVSHGFGSTGYPASQSIVRTLYSNNENSSVMAKIKFLQLAEQDTLYIYNGTSPSGSPAAVFSGITKTTETTVLATNDFGALTFVFNSNSTDSLAGFKADITCATNGTQLQNGSSWLCDAFLISPNYPEHYPNNTTITHTIYPETSGKYVRIDFDNLNLGSGDYLYIYNGTNIYAPLIGSYSGSITAFSKIAYNTSGALTIRLVTDSWTAGTGFYAKLSCSELPETMAGGSVALCDRLYASPGFPNNYANNEAITETIYPVYPNGKVSMDFSFLLTESLDKLYIYDGTSTSDPLIGIYSGTVSPGKITATNSSGALTLRFSSDGSVAKEGWLAEVSCVYPTGISGPLEKNVTIYPVPADDHLKVNSSEKILGFQIVNVLGEEILHGKAAPDVFEISTSSVPEGIYMINLFYPEGTVTRKFIIAR